MDWIEDPRVSAWFARSDADGDPSELGAYLRHPLVRVAHVGRLFDVVVMPAGVGSRACASVSRHLLGPIVASDYGNWSVLVPPGTAAAWTDMGGPAALADAVCSPSALYVWLPATPPAPGAPVHWAVPPRPADDGVPILTDPRRLAAALRRAGSIRAGPAR